MISDSDADFHTPTSDDQTWAETNFFGCYVPEAHLNIGVYALFRPNAGVVISTVHINSRFVDQPWQGDYWDPQHHLAIPEPRNLRDYSLANGLSVQCTEPNRVWDVSYHNGTDVDLAFRYSALGDAYDISDPAQDPITAAQQADASFAWGEAYRGHFDQTGWFEGELNLRGIRYPIACVSTMDHSWGLRPEHQGHNMTWLHAHFSREFAIHGIFDFDHTAGPDAVTQGALTHGYVLDHGEVVGLKAGHNRVVRQGYYAKGLEIEVEDARGRTHRAHGFGRTSFPWQAGPGTVGYNVLAQWRLDDGSRAEGWGEIQEFVGPQHLTALYAERAGAGAR